MYALFVDLKCFGWFELQDMIIGNNNNSKREMQILGLGSEFEVRGQKVDVSDDGEEVIRPA